MPPKVEMKERKAAIHCPHCGFVLCSVDHSKNETDHPAKVTFEIKVICHNRHCPHKKKHHKAWSDTFALTMETK